MMRLINVYDLPYLDIGLHSHKSTANLEVL